VLTPRANQRDEQRMRADRLAGRGLVEAVEPEQLTARVLGAAAHRAVERGRRAVHQQPAGEVALSGLSQVARAIERLLPVLDPPAAPAFRAMGALA
jgi:predicted glycosyltransferase